MNWDIIEGKWSQLKGQAKIKWGELTDDDLEIAAGKSEELAGRIQERYGKSKEEAEREVEEWSASLDD